MPETIEEGERFGKKPCKDDENVLGHAEELKELNRPNNINGTTETSKLNGHTTVDN